MSCGEPLSIPLAGGRALAARVWRAERAVRRALVVLGALGAPQRYLRHLAPWLAERGWGVLTLDYRGVGASRAAGDARTNLDDWGDDALAAIAAARARFGVERPAVLGHSLGGMLLGHSGAGAQVAGAVVVAATHGAPRHWGLSRDRLRVELAYRVVPPLTRLRGRVPAFVFGASLPRDAYLQWVRWGQRGRFERWDGAPSAPWFARHTGPLVALVARDDGYAPPAAVEALLAAFGAARAPRREVLEPRRGERIGHFGLFRPDAPAWAREVLAGLLEEVAG